jgi:hypothetical protein
MQHEDAASEQTGIQGVGTGTQQRQDERLRGCEDGPDGDRGGAGNEGDGLDYCTDCGGGRREQAGANRHRECEQCCESQPMGIVNEVTGAVQMQGERNQAAKYGQSVAGRPRREHRIESLHPGNRKSFARRGVPERWIVADYTFGVCDGEPCNEECFSKHEVERSQ